MKPMYTILLGTLTKYSNSVYRKLFQNFLQLKLHGTQFGQHIEWFFTKVDLSMCDAFKGNGNQKPIRGEGGKVIVYNLPH